MFFLDWKWPPLPPSFGDLLKIHKILGRQGSLRFQHFIVAHFLWQSPITVVLKILSPFGAGGFWTTKSADRWFLGRLEKPWSLDVEPFPAALHVPTEEHHPPGLLLLLLLYVLLLPPLHHRGPRPWVDNPPSPALRRAEGTPLLWLIHGQENQPQPHRKTMNQLLARDKKVPKKGWNYGLRGNIDKVLIMEKRLWILYGCGNPLEWTSADERGWKYVRKDPMDMFICLSLQFADSVVNRG